jgi:hypothetical protein
VFLKELGIDPKVMQDTVLTTARAVTVAIPEAGFELVNQILKLGVTIGYKLSIKRQMEDEFNTKEDDVN